MFENEDRKIDTKVFEQLKLYISSKESVDLDKFLNSPELRKKYRVEYQELCEYLKQNPKKRSDSLELNIKYCDIAWYAFFDTLTSIEERRKKVINQYSITEFSKLSHQELYDIVHQCTREEMERERQVDASMPQNYSGTKKIRQEIDNRFIDAIHNTEEEYKKINFDRFNTMLETMIKQDSAKKPETTDSKKIAK